MEFKLADIERLFDKIKAILQELEDVNLFNRKTDITLANGEIIHYCLERKHLAHLLGINTTNQVLQNMFNETSSFKLLEKILDNPYKISSSINNGLLKANDVFSQYIEGKGDSFSNNLRINIDYISAIVKIDKSKSYTLVQDVVNYDYLIVKEYAGEKFGVVGLSKGENDKYYSPRTNQIFENFEDFKSEMEKYIINQTLTLATSSQSFFKPNEYYDEVYLGKKYILSIDKKATKIYDLIGYKKKFAGSTIDTSVDYKYFINKVRENRQTKFINNDIFETIVTNIKNCTLIDTNGITDDKLINVINAVNDMIFDNPGNKNELNYTELIKQLNELKSKITLLKQNNEIQQEQISNLKTERQLLTEENYKLNDQVQKVYEIVKPSN